MFLLVLITLISAADAQQCDYDPLCAPLTLPCGCGGTQTRYTLCDGGCAPWSECSVADTETSCTDTIDNDCDQLTDCEDTDCENQQVCIDNDEDGFPLDTDCNDDDPDIRPDASESCNNLDDNCNGLIDEGLSRQCGQTNVGECTIGAETCSRGTWLDCNAILPKDEICNNNLDDDCDGEVDEGCPEDTQDEPEEQQEQEPEEEQEPEQPAETPEEEQEEQQPAQQPELIVAEKPCIDADGDTYGVDCPAGFDCDDADAAVNPGAAEICNNIDDDCNNIIDDQVTRQCGTTDIGACSFGTEQCTAGVWSGCTATFPEEELCDNNLDDDCDGNIDEGCEEGLSKEELALNQFLNLKYGKGQYDWDRYLDNYRKTEKFINIKKSSEIADSRTKIKIEIIPVQGLREITIFEYIPKSIAHSSDVITFSIEPEIIQSDPLVAWHFAELDRKAEVSYEVLGEVEKAEELTETIAFAEEAAPIEKPWYFNLLPLLMIPIIGFVFIYLIEVLHKKRK